MRKSKIKKLEQLSNFLSFALLLVETKQVWPNAVKNSPLDTWEGLKKIIAGKTCLGHTKVLRLTTRKKLN